MTLKEWWCAWAWWHDRSRAFCWLSDITTYHKCSVCGCEWSYHHGLNAELPYRLTREFYRNLQNGKQ